MDNEILAFAKKFVEVARHLKSQVFKLEWIRAIEGSGDLGFACDEIFRYRGITDGIICSITEDNADLVAFKDEIEKSIDIDTELLRLRCCSLIVILRLAVKGRMPDASHLLAIYCKIYQQYKKASSFIFLT